MRLGAYKNIPVRRVPVTVDDAQIDRILENIQYNNRLQITVDDRAARSGDLVFLNFKTDEPRRQAHDRKAFPVTLGQHSLPEQTEEAIIGNAAGEQLQLNIAFPQDFPAASLAGRQTDCTVLIHKICCTEMQPIDDDFALDFSEYGSLQEWRDALYLEIEENRAGEAAVLEQEELLDAIIADSDIPVDESLAGAVSEEMYEDLLYDIRAYHMEPDEWLQRTGRTEESLRQEQYEQAVLTIQRQSVLHAVAEAEHITVSEDELNDRLAEIACEEGFDEADFDDEEREAIEDELIMDKSMDFLLASANFI